MKFIFSGRIWPLGSTQYGSYSSLRWTQYAQRAQQSGRKHTHTQIKLDDTRRALPLEPMLAPPCVWRPFPCRTRRAQSTGDRHENASMCGMTDGIHHHAVPRPRGGFGQQPDAATGPRDKQSAIRDCKQYTPPRPSLLCLTALWNWPRLGHTF